MDPLALYAIPRRVEPDEGSPRFLSLARRSLTLAFGSVRDDMKTFGMTRKNGQDDAERKNLTQERAPFGARSCMRDDKKQKDSS